MPTYLPAPQDQQFGVCRCVQGATLRLRSRTHRHPHSGLCGDERWGGAGGQAVRGASVGEAVAMPSLCPHNSGDGGSHLLHYSWLGRSWGGGPQRLTPRTPPSALAEWAHCDRHMALSECWHRLWPWVVLLAKASLLHAKACGLNARSTHRGQLTQLSFRSLQLHVPREVPEAREDPLCGCGAQPGPSAYGVWAEGWGGRLL